MFVNLNTLVKEVRDVVIPADRGFVFNPCVLKFLSIITLKFLLPYNRFNGKHNISVGRRFPVSHSIKTESW